MADLTRASGVPTASIKFYLREGLLHPGERTAPNQATYGESHLSRLRLIRALREVAGLGVETIRRLLRTIDDPHEDVLAVLGQVTDALLEPDGPPASRTPEQLAAEAGVERVFTILGWEVEPTSATRRRLADAALAMRDNCLPGAPIEMLIPYGQAVAPLARMEVEMSLGPGAQPSSGGGRDASLLTVVTGTILGEQILTAMRRAAHEHYAKLLERGKAGPKRAARRR